MLRPEGLSLKVQREDRSTFSATLSSKLETDFLEDMHPFIIVSMQRRAEKSQGQATRPLLGLPTYENAFAPDLFTPTSGSNQERPREGGGQLAAIPGRPA